MANWHPSWAIDKGKGLTPFKAAFDTLSAFAQKYNLLDFTPFDLPEKRDFLFSDYNNSLFESIISFCKTNYANHTINGGDFDDTLAMPFWTDETILVAIGQDSFIENPKSLKCADYFYQLYKVLNLMRYGVKKYLTDDVRYYGTLDNIPGNTKEEALSNAFAAVVLKGGLAVEGWQTIYIDPIYTATCSYSEYEFPVSDFQAAVDMYGWFATFYFGFDGYIKPIGLINGVHGTAEYIQKYYQVAERIQPSGWNQLVQFADLEWTPDINDGRHKAFGSASINKPFYAVLKADGVNGFTYENWL